MATPTVIQVVLGTLFAALGIFGFFVSIFPAKTRRLGWAYFSTFAFLTVLGVVLLAWQAMLAERSQLAADRAADELRRQVAVLYEAQTRSYRRPTQEEIDGLADRVYMLKREAQFRTSRDLKLETRLLSAEILLFVAERSRKAPRIEMLEGSEGVAGLLDDMKRPSVREPRSDEERMDEAGRRFQTPVMDPLGKVGLTEAEKRWFKQNKPAIDYHFETKRLFSNQFGKRVDRTSAALEEAKVVDFSWLATYALLRPGNVERMRELGVQLAEVAERLPEAPRH